jgi:hypothetical protein
MTGKNFDLSSTAFQPTAMTKQNRISHFNRCPRGICDPGTLIGAGVTRILKKLPLALKQL